MTKQNEVFDLSAYLLHHDNLSDSQRAIAEYLCANPGDGLTQTAAEIGAAVGVSASTVVRFAQSIGFSGLADLQRLLGCHVKQLLRSREPLERLKYVNEQLGLDTAKSGYDIFLNVAHSEMSNIESTMQMVVREQYEETVKQLADSEAVYVLGLRGSLSLAVQFTSGMRYVRPNVFHLDNYGNDLPDKLASLNRGDALVAFSYSPYTSTTVKAAGACRSLGVHVTVITDNEHSPATQQADCVLVTKNPVWFSSTTGGSTALVNSLVYATATYSRARTASYIDKAKSLVETLSEFELTSWDNLMSIVAFETRA